MNRLLSRFLALLLLIGTWGLANANDFVNTRFSAIVEEGMQAWHVPGMAVAVIENGEVVFQKGFGVTAVDHGRSVDQHTLFAIASTTKAMVVSGILMLADEGKLSLDDLAIQHVPELHFSSESLTSQLTIRDLLAHRTGLPSTDFWTFEQSMSLDEQIRRLRLVEPATPPRTRFIYQNTMFEIAGLIIERVSGQTWDAFLAQRLWAPIGMRETVSTRGQIDNSHRHAFPHAYLQGKVRQVAWDLYENLPDAAGSVWSSVHDMSLWARFLLRDGVTADGTRLISEESMHEMFEPQMLSTPDDFYPTVKLTKPHWRSYGLGWFQQDFQGRVIDFHTGSLSGLIAIIGLDREAKRAVIVLGNRDHAEMRHALLWEVMDTTPPDHKRDWNADILDLYRDLENQDRQAWEEKARARLEGTQPSLPLAAYAGTYRSPVHGDISVRLMDEKLRVDTVTHQYTLSHWHLDTFLLMHPEWEHGALTTFSMASDGSVASFGLGSDVFSRVAN